MSTEPKWLTERRRRGAKMAKGLELPSTKAKGWEFTDLEDLDLNAYEPVADGGGPEVPPVLRVPGDAPEIRQRGAETLDGHEAPEKPDRPIVMPLQEAAARYPDLVEDSFGSIVTQEDPFVARNEADWHGGAFIYLPPGSRMEVPAQLSAVHTHSGSSLSFRTLIVLEDNAEAEVWEQWLGDSDSEGLFNTVTELRVGPGARLRYVCGQRLSHRSWVFGTQRAEVDRDGHLEWVALGFGSGRGKVRMETKLAGQGSSARVTGGYAGNGGQHLDYDTTQEHAAPSTVSDLAFRGVLEDEATAVWRGMIRVDPGAQQTDAFQESRNLLLSKSAHADAVPGLEIEANDVRCTHAAAVAQIDPEQLYYLRAHGLHHADAARLIIQGFLGALLERLPGGAVHEAVSGALEWRLNEILGPPS